MTTASHDPQSSSISKWWANPFVRIALLGSFYFLSAKLGLLFIAQPEGWAAIWPASGVALAWLLLSKRSQWPVILGIIFLVNALSNLISGNSLVISVGFGFANTLEPAVGAWLMTRLCVKRITFTRLADVLALMTAAILGNGLTALVGALVPTIGLRASYWDVWLIWWLSNGLGILAVTPFLVTWFSDARISPASSRRSRLEVIFWVVILCVSTWFMFGASGVTIRLEPRPYMLFPVLLWGALRFSSRSTATMLVFMNIIALGCTAAGWGMFPLGGDTTTDRLIAVQGFCCVASIATMMFSATLAERKQTEIALQEQELWLRESQRVAHVGTYRLDILAGEWQSTAVLDDIFGIDASYHKDVSGWQALIHPAQQVEMLAYFQNEVAAAKAKFNKEYRIIRQSDQQERWVHGRGELILDSNGKPVVMFGTIQDITERKRAESERERLFVELERKNKELESIIYVASHDLRSPLVNIQGFGRNLQKYFGQISSLLENAPSLEEFLSMARPILTERIPNALRFVETSSAKMDTLIDALLRVSRLGRAALQIGDVDMSLMIQNILDSMAFQIDKAHAQVNLHQSLAPCRGDKNMLNQVFSNLLDNALKYRDPNRPLSITISSRLEAQKAIYTVADTGLGIAPENQDKIWEIFRRLEDDAAIPGEGLGLTIARRIVERHNGRIWVESQPGTGSRFFVELPAKSS